MVKIPERLYAYLATNLPAAASPGAAAASAGTEAWQALGQSMQTIVRSGLVMQQQRDHDLLVDAQNRYTNAMTAFSTEAETSRTGEKARGFTRDFTGRSGETRDETAAWLRENGGSGNALRAFTGWAEGRAVQGLAGASRFEHGQMLAHGKDMFEQRIQGITDGLERDPAAFGDAAGQLEEAFTMGVGQGLFRPEEAKARLHDAREKLSLTAFDNMYAMDRGRAMGSMEALGLTPAQQAKAKKRYQADVRSDAAQARAAANERKAELLSTIEDDDYTAKMTGDVSSLMKTASELRRLGDAKRAEILERRASVYENNQVAIRESNAQTLPDLAESINGLHTELRTLQTQGAEADARKMRQLDAEISTRTDIYQHRAALFLKNPMGQALQGEAPQQITEANVTRLMAKQEAMGAGVPGFVPRPMTAENAADVNARWTQSTDAAAKAGMLETLRAQYGRHLPAVLEQAKLPSALLAVAPVLDALAPAQISRMVLAAEAKDKDLPSPSKDQKDQLANSPVLRVLRHTGDVMYRSGAQMAFATKTARAWEHYAAAGGDPSGLDDAFWTLEGPGYAIAAPRKIVTKDQESALEAGLDAVVRDHLSAINTGKTPQARTKALREQSLWRNGTWVYDADGYFLFVDAATGQGVERLHRDEIVRRAGDPRAYNLMESD